MYNLSKKQLENLFPPFEVFEITKSKDHIDFKLPSWRGKKSLLVKAKDKTVWDLDIREAYSEEFIYQDLIDFGVNKKSLIEQTHKLKIKPSKAIMYFCNENIKDLLNKLNILKFREKNFFYKSKNILWYQIPEKYHTESCWKQIWRAYVFRPRKLKILTEKTHSKIFNKEKNFSTTRKNKKELKILGNNNMNNVNVISIITVVYNDSIYLEKTIQSVINQKNSLVEYLIIDGGSTDDTLQIIEKYLEFINFFLSEKDRGIYDAMNKGVSNITGNFHSFLGAGDYYWNLEALRNINREGFLETLYISRQGFIKKIKFRSPKNGMPYNHQGLFYRKKISYNLKYSIASDFDRTLKEINILDNCLGDGVMYRNDGISSISFLARIESCKIISNHYGWYYSIIPFIIEISKYSVIYIMKKLKFFK